MKILPVPLIREADAFTIAHEPIADIDLMERAATACFRWLEENTGRDRKIFVFCGGGNNGGDGLAIARMMHGAGFSVHVYYTAPPEKMSQSCRINLDRLEKCRGIAECRLLRDPGELPRLEKADVVIDALFGSGLTRPVEGLAARVIDHIVSSQAVTVAIDIPSGMFCDEATPAGKDHAVIRADYTLTFSPPKLGFFFPGNDRYTGNWILLDIGIMKEFTDAAETRDFMVEKADVARILKKRNKFAHKGNFGHALLICGSTGKMGAAVLAARGCLRSGAGLVTLRTPGSGVQIIQTAVPEAMLTIDPDTDRFTALPDLSPYNSVAVGPGIGTSPQTASALKVLIQEMKAPVIFDADAINILGENKTWLGFLPPDCIFTPHPREFERLAGKWSDDSERNRMQRDFSARFRCYIVLKGAYSAITTPDGQCWFNTTGNPGMATGGSGDVLTGILAGLRAQGYTPFETCLLGVYLHGLSGDLAASDYGYEALIAHDITDYMGKSFQLLYGKL